MKVATAALAASLFACTAPVTPSTGTAADDVQQTRDPTEPTAQQSSIPARSSTDLCATTPKADAASQACYRWRCESSPTKDASWDGSSLSCTAGTVDADGAARALARINLHRELAGLAPFVQESSWVVAGQACALLAQANEKLSHTPSTDWKCYSKLGGDISEGSLVANRSAPPSIAAYFEDPANEPTMVHRRWLLDETLASVGIGTTTGYSCIVVDGSKVVGKAKTHPTNARGWAAWPPAGAIPIDVFTDEKLDTAGWTLQSTASDLDAATVSVTVDGAPAPVTVTHLEPLMGSRSALRFVPQGWVTQAGHAYSVHVTGAAAIPDFAVEPFACSE
jgi:hypothetical protein